MKKTKGISSDAFAVCVTARSLSIPRLPFKKMKEEVLGPRYSLSLAFVSSALSRNLNRSLRGKDKSANVLAFPLSRESGEILVTPAVAKHQAPLYGMSYRSFVGLLFIHGLFHLKGRRHGGTMEREECRVRRIFSL